MKNSFTRDVGVSAIVLVVALLIPSFTSSVALLDFGIRLAALGIFATSLNILVGFGGMVSFGHALYFGLGAYAFGLLLQHFSMPILLALLLAVALTGIVAAIIGAICVKLTETSFSFITLAFQMLFHSILISWPAFTGGDQGLMGGLPRPPILGFDLIDPKNLFRFACVLTVLSLLAMRCILQSPFGYTLRMVRDNTERARFLGVNVERVKLYAFIIASCFASVGGVVIALFVSGAFPEFTYWTMSGEAVFMVLLGGINYFLGPILGAATLLTFNDVVTRLTDHHGLLLGAVVLLFTLVFKRGIADFLIAGWQAVRARSRPSRVPIDSPALAVRASASAVNPVKEACDAAR